MLIDNRPYAPHFGVWHLAGNDLPPMGRAVLGLNWTASGGVFIGLMEWRILESTDDIDEELVFQVADRDGDANRHDAAWFLSFSEDFVEGGEERMMPAPTLWAETRFIIPVPLQFCDDCGGLRDNDEDCCE